MNQPEDPTSDRDPTDDSAWTCAEIERLYQKALDAVGAVASEIDSATEALAIDETGDDDSAQLTVGDAVPDGPGLSASANGDPEQLIAAPPGAISEQRLTSAQVIEAFLFVGGQPLTAKTICSTLRGELDSDAVDQAIAEINQRYARQNRPYEIRLGDGGYRIALRSEFEPIRNRVYGFGPRQVRLSQETLEILALIAYRQPISRGTIEEIARGSAGSHLRQLLQRELVVLDRGADSGDSQPCYRTSARFLQLFGLGRLDELPQIEDLNFK